MYYVDCILTPEQRTALIDAGVDVEERMIGDEFYHRHGISFPEDDLNTVAPILGLLVDDNGSGEEMETPQGEYIPDLCELPVLPHPTAERPVTCRNNRHYDIRFYRILRDLQPEVRHGLIFCHSDGGESPYRYAPGVIVVYTGATPPDGEAHGVRRESNQSGIRTNVEGLGDEYLVIHHDDGSQLAFFRGSSEGGTLWIPFWYEDIPNGRRHLEFIFHLLARHLRPELGDSPSYAEYEQMASRLSFVRLVTRSLELEEGEIDHRVDNADLEVETSRQQLINALRTANAFRRRREAIATMSREERIAQLTEQLNRDLDTLLGSDDVESAEFTSDETITVVTRPIHLLHEGNIYEMGRYSIRIGTSSLRITSMEGVDTGRYCHPHIRNNGDACLGNIGESVARLQASMSYGDLVMLIVRYLEHGYNPADSFRLIEDFNVPVHNSEEVNQDEAAVEQRPRRRRRRASSGGYSS